MVCKTCGPIEYMFVKSLFKVDRSGPLPVLFQNFVKPPAIDYDKSIKMFKFPSSTAVLSVSIKVAIQWLLYLRAMSSNLEKRSTRLIDSFMLSDAQKRCFRFSACFSRSAATVSLRWVFRIFKADLLSFPIHRLCSAQSGLFFHVVPLVADKVQPQNP